MNEYYVRVVRTAQELEELLNAMGKTDWRPIYFQASDPQNLSEPKTLVVFEREKPF